MPTLDEGQLRSILPSPRTLGSGACQDEHYATGRPSQVEDDALPIDNETMIGDLARRLLESVEVEDGVRLLGMGMSSLAEMVQQDLFDSPATAKLAEAGGSC